MQQPRSRPRDPDPVDRSIPFVETHYHLWELHRFPYRWLSGTCADELLGDYSAICEDMPPQRVHRQFDAQNVSARVHIEADSGAEDPVDETRWLETVAEANGSPDALIVFCDLEATDAEMQLERHIAASPRVRGVRIREHPAKLSAAFQTAFVALGRHGMSYELSASPGRLGQAREHLDSLPDVPVMVSHAGFPVERDRPYLARWRAELRSLAELDHVACKVSGFATVDHDWTIATLTPLVMTCIEAFGVNRIVFGTDWPVGSLFSTYDEQVDAFRSIVASAGFSKEEQARMLNGNAQRLYRL